MCPRVNGNAVRCAGRGESAPPPSRSTAGAHGRGGGEGLAEGRITARRANRSRRHEFTEQLHVPGGPLGPGSLLQGEERQRLRLSVRRQPAHRHRPEAQAVGLMCSSPDVGP